MFRTTATIDTSGMAGLTARIEALARRATLAAAEKAAATAQAAASIDLELEIVDPHEDPDGVAAGIKSQKRGHRGTRIADFFDEGTLGKRKKPRKRAGRGSWAVKRDGGAYTAERHDVSGKGIEAERFFPKAKAAGRRELLDQLKRP